MRLEWSHALCIIPTPRQRSNAISSVYVFSRPCRKDVCFSMCNRCLMTFCTLRSMKVQSHVSANRFLEVRPRKNVSFSRCEWTLSQGVFWHPGMSHGPKTHSGGVGGLSAACVASSPSDGSFDEWSGAHKRWTWGSEESNEIRTIFALHPPFLPSACSLILVVL